MLQTISDMLLPVKRALCGRGWVRIDALASMLYEQVPPEIAVRIASGKCNYERKTRKVLGVAPEEWRESLEEWPESLLETRRHAGVRYMITQCLAPYRMKQQARKHLEARWNREGVLEYRFRPPRITDEVKLALLHAMEGGNAMSFDQLVKRAGGCVSDARAERYSHRKSGPRRPGRRECVRLRLKRLWENGLVNCSTTAGKRRFRITHSGRDSLLWSDEEERRTLNADTFPQLPTPPDT